MRTKATTIACSCFVALSVCANLAFISLFRQAALRSSVHSPVPADCQPRRTSAAAAAAGSEAQTVIQTTHEALHSMYGEGNFTDDDDNTRHLFNYIRSMMSQQGTGGYHLEKPSRIHYSQFGGSAFVDRLLKKRRNGFFVECGAFTGEDLSDTLFFELERNWTGLLIEAHPDYHREILKKNRRALVMRGCLSSSRRPGLVKFRLQGWGSGVSALNKNVEADDKIFPETDVQCFSLNSIMAAIGVHHIDLFVLDVEGAELPILETIDWSKLSIDVFSIEYSPGKTYANNIGDRRYKFRDFFRRTHKRTGQMYKEVEWADNYSNQDVIYMKDNLF